jgi:hypothetical protein
MTFRQADCCRGSNHPDKTPDGLCQTPRFYFIDQVAIYSACLYFAAAEPVLLHTQVCTPDGVDIAT